MAKIKSSLKTRQKKLAEGKTKVIFPFPRNKSLARLVHKDDITAGDGAKHDILLGKGAWAATTSNNCFALLTAAGIPNHFVDRGKSEKEQIVKKSDMVPLEVVARRIATGSYLKRNPQSSEGQRFDELVTELFYKDDTKHDPIIEFDSQTKEWVFYDAKSTKRAGFMETTKQIKTASGKIVSPETVGEMYKILREVFIILEHAWASHNIQLVDLKIEFGFDTEGNLIVADVIDNDSWRLWPAGKKEAMLDKQIYRNLISASKDDLDAIAKKYQSVAELTTDFVKEDVGTVAIIMGSVGDKEWVDKIVDKLKKFSGISIETIIASAHKTPDYVSTWVKKLDSTNSNLVYIAVAGRSNALGAYLDFATPNPVINCPPYSEKYAGSDIYSSLRLPSGSGALTVIEPEAAAISAAKIFSENNLLTWARLFKFQKGLRNKITSAN
ncbi:AIR carboxylase family protein [Patescibacteria group bacterium]|nr:AIR carboxylase family protein [Patescibacteria group bacterium]